MISNKVPVCSLHIKPSCRFVCGCRYRCGWPPSPLYSAHEFCQGLGSRLPPTEHQRNPMLDRDSPAQGAAAVGWGSPHNAHRRPHSLRLRHCSHNDRYCWPVWLKQWNERSFSCSDRCQHHWDMLNITGHVDSCCLVSLTQSHLLLIEKFHFLFCFSCFISSHILIWSSEWRAAGGVNADVEILNLKSVFAWKSKHNCS